jgi:hypothetical protein
MSSTTAAATTHVTVNALIKSAVCRSCRLPPVPGSFGTREPALVCASKHSQTNNLMTKLGSIRD